MPPQADAQVIEAVIRAVLDDGTGTGGEDGEGGAGAGAQAPPALGAADGGRSARAEALAVALDSAPLLDRARLAAVDHALRVGRAARQLEREAASGAPQGSS